MTLPGPKRLILSMSKEIAEENRDDLLVLLEGEPLPESARPGLCEWTLWAGTMRWPKSWAGLSPPPAFLLPPCTDGCLHCSSVGRAPHC